MAPSAVGYLAAARERANLVVVTGAQATRLALDSAYDGASRLQVSGIEFARGDEREPCCV